ncbi:MAG TPA: ABC transporter permease [Tepidisphaeraceae bacterium]|jgi:NitT/TauT family transport system permease protein|nr:ABC transporter permease [Tepidisphaeraceae bacterium]
MKRGHWLGTAIPPVIVLLAVAITVELVVRLDHVPAYTFPSTSAVVLALGTHWRDLSASLWTTAQGALIGFAASAIFGIAAAIVLASSVWIRRAFYPYTIFFQTVPIIAIAPLLVFWLSAGLEAVAMSAFIVSVFPVIASTLNGLLSTDPALVDLFRLYRAGPVARLLKLRLPAALPDILVGLRVAAGLAVIGTVVSEFLVGTLGNSEGLGVRIVSGVKYGHPDVVFAAVLLVSGLGLALFGAVNLVGHLLLRRWHASEQNA